MKWSRHLWAPLAFALTFCTIGQACFAQAYPAKPLRFVVPYGAGGGPDVLARVKNEMGVD